MITPTVTIGLHEYENLKKLETALFKKEFITYHYNNWHVGGLMFVVDADESTKKMVKEIEWLNKQHDILVKEIDAARKKIIDLEIQSSRKKWYQIWK